MIVGDGRPLRFLAMVGGGWIALRVAMVWHATGSPPRAIRDMLPLPGQVISALSPARSFAAAPTPAALRTAVATPTVRWPSVRAPATQPAIESTESLSVSVADPVPVRLALSASARIAGAGYRAPVVTPLAPVAHAIAPVPVVGSQTSRFLVSSWMIVRPGAGSGVSALSPQLGGTQGGVRIDYAVTRQIAVAARAAAPAAGAGRELSLGIAWRPTGVPLRFVVEQRLALDRGRSGPALGVSGGVSELALPAGFRLDGYGQAGAIFRDGVEHYVDGSIRSARPVATMAGIAVDLGAGAWGGAQRGVARLDVGPSVGLGVPVGDRRVRVSLDWRQRIAGNARPGSGPALNLGTDF